MITILNTSILTNYGSYMYEPISLEDAKASLSELTCDACGHHGNISPSMPQCTVCGYDYCHWQPQFQSAVGHQSTAEILTELLGVSVPMNRMSYAQGVGEKALVFKLKARAPEGVILSRQEIEAIGYEFGLLLRVE